MIISHNNKYLFLQTPHTASTAIANELCKFYNGESILRKHANYLEFKRMSNSKEKNYFVFSTVRNPLDEATSIYTKYLTNHKSNYTDIKKRLENGGWVSKKHIRRYLFTQNKENDFGDFLKKFFSHPYISVIEVNKKYCDYIMRYENIQNDFSNVLKLLDLKEVRPLPVLNKTENKSHYLHYYKDDDTIKHAIKISGPFMKEWGYSFPSHWNASRYNSLSFFEYYITKRIMLHDSKCRKVSPLIRLLREIGIEYVPFPRRKR